MTPACPNKIFLLSPANAGGERARRILRGKSNLALDLLGRGVQLGDVFSLFSGLYFRGKLAYARAFAQPPEGVGGVYIITAGRGLMPPETIVTLEDLEAIAAVPIDAAEPRYSAPLLRDAQELAQAAGRGCPVILLGSIATEKYAAPLLEAFGDRLHFPAEFVGRGDMSRGGLMLRAAMNGSELSYIAVSGARRRGPRPPRLPPI